MSTMTAEKVETLDACFGNYPQTQALKSGAHQIRPRGAPPHRSQSDL